MTDIWTRKYWFFIWNAYYIIINIDVYWVVRFILVKFYPCLSRTQIADLKCSSSLLSSPQSKQKYVEGVVREWAWKRGLATSWTHSIQLSTTAQLGPSSALGVSKNNIWFQPKCDFKVLVILKQIFNPFVLLSANMSSSKTTKTYSYRSVGGGNADINIDYTHDLTALSRLEVSLIWFILFANIIELS